MTSKKRRRKFIETNKNYNIDLTKSYINKKSKKEYIISIISLIISLISLIVTFYIGIEANDISRRNQNMDYQINIKENQVILSAKNSNDGVIYIGENIKLNITNNNNGLLKSVFVATVDGDNPDIYYVGSPRIKNDYGVSDDLKTFLDKTIITPVVFSNNNMIFNLIPPIYKSTWGNINKQLNIIHIILKGYNNSISVYSILYFCTNEIVQIEPYLYYSNMKFYVVDDDTIYNYEILDNISKEMNEYNELREIECDTFTHKSILDKLKKERKLIYDELKYNY